MKSGNHQAGDGLDLPRISIITPSFNQAQFLEATIRSVLDQGYPDLEYIVIDGGSTDGSLEIVRAHAGDLAYWISEPDRGQAHAINKGIARSSGQILGWLNSDDLYEPGALLRVGTAFRDSQETKVVFGDCLFIDERGELIGAYPGVDRSFVRKLMYWRDWDIPQPTVFLRREVAQQAGPLDEAMSYSIDYEWFLRIASRHRFVHLGQVLARYRRHEASLTGDWEQARARFERENFVVSRRYWGSPWGWRYWILLLSYGWYRGSDPLWRTGRAAKRALLARMETAGVDESERSR